MLDAGMLSPDTLKRYQPFSSLNEHQLLQIVGVVEIRSVDNREVLFHSGDIDNEEYFLLEGGVELTAADGHARKIMAADEQALRALSRLRPRQYTAKALPDTVLVVIDTEVLEALADENVKAPALSVGVSEVDDSDERPYAVLLEDFRNDLASNRCVLPSLPEVAIKVRKLLEDENSSAEQIARVVNSDPAIAAKLIGAANSPVFHGSAHVDTTAHAIVRLGLNTTRQLVISYAMRDLFTSRSPELKLRMQRVWLCSVEVAAIAYVLAKKVKNYHDTPDEVMLAGLLNDVGVIAIVNYLEQNPIWLEQGIDVDDLVTQLRADAGIEILQHWHFPESFIRVVCESEHWARQHQHSLDMADIVQVAKLYTLMHNRAYVRKGAALPKFDTVDSLKKLDLGEMTPEKTIAIIAQAREQIDAARAMLQL